MNTAWLIPTLFSAFTLGIYDVCKKSSVKDNAVMPVLFFATLSGTIFFLIATCITGNAAAAVYCSRSEYLLTLLKAAIVGSSWVCAFYAMRELPITLAAPIRATSPLWTAIGGLLIYNEIPRPLIVLGGAWALRSCFGKRAEFHWKWSIPLTGILLIMADYAYFYALSSDHAPISMVSLVRRCSCVVTFIVGARLFKDGRLKIKAAALALLLIGVILIARG